MPLMRTTKDPWQNDGPLTTEQAKAEMQRLERREWLRLTSVISMVLAFTLVVAWLATRTLMHDAFELNQITVSVRGLWAVVLIFGIFSFYQQATITRLRRQIATQLAVAAAAEVMRPATQVDEGWKLQRKFPRYYFDERVTVRTDSGPRPLVSSGRTMDISEGGLGAVLPDAFESGVTVLVEVRLPGTEGQLVMPAIVRHRRGYYHGMEFSTLTPTMRQRLRESCQGHPVLQSRSPVDPLYDGDARAHVQ